MKGTRILLLPLFVFLLASFPIIRGPNWSRARAGQILKTTEPAPRHPACCSAPRAAPVKAAQGLTPPAIAQNSGAKPDPPGTIDGAKNPELIPDEVALRVVLLALAEPENANEAQKERFRAKIARAGLDEGDTDALFRVLGSFQNHLDDLQTQATQILGRNPFPPPGSVDYQKLLDLSRQREQVFAEAMSAVPARLSLAGAAKLQTYVENEKRGMKYLPDKPMAAR